MLDVKSQFLGIFYRMLWFISISKLFFPYFIRNEDKENILKLFPNAQIVPVEGASHMIHGLYHEFENAVIPFLKNIN